MIKPQKLNLLIDIQEKIISKGAAYERWATNFNLKSMSKTLLFLRDHKIETVEDLKAMEEEATNKFNDLSAGIKEKEAKMAEMLALKNKSSIMQIPERFIFSIVNLDTVRNSLSRTVKQSLCIRQRSKLSMIADLRKSLQSRN